MLHSAFSRSPTALFYKDCYEFVLQFPALTVQDCSVIVGAVSAVTLILNCVFLKGWEDDGDGGKELSGSLSTPYPESAIHHCPMRHPVTNSRVMIDLKMKPGNGDIGKDTGDHKVYVASGTNGCGSCGDKNVYSMFEGGCFDMEEYYVKMVGEDPRNPMLLRNYGQFLYQGQLLAVYEDMTGDYFKRALEESANSFAIQAYEKFIHKVHANFILKKTPLEHFDKQDL